jgi:hypothetical protein
MRGARRRLATVVLLAAGVASCEALVGIKDRELAPQDGSATGPGSDGASTEVGAGDGDDIRADGAPGTPGDGMTDVGVSADGGGEQEESGGNDAGGSRSDGGDAGAVDAPVGDGGGVVVDAADGALPMDPDVPCAQQPSFLYCNDFDSVSSAGQTWDFDYLSNPDSGAVLQIDSTTYVSAPHSVQIIAPTVGAVSEIQLGKDVGILSSNCRLAFDVRIDVSTFNGIPQVGVAQMYIQRTVNPLQVNYVIGPGAVSSVQVYGTTDSGGPINVPVSAPTPMGWARIVLAYDSVTGLSVYKNGQLQGTLGVGPGAPGDTKIIMGNPFINTDGTQTVTTEEDNIVLSGR